MNTKKKIEKIVKRVDVKKWLNDKRRIRIPEGANAMIWFELK